MLFRNAFLSSVDSADLDDLAATLKEVALFADQPLNEPGEAVDWIYFPSSCVISTIALMPDGREVETTSIGYEGATGLAQALTQDAPMTRMTVRIDGAALALPAAILAERAFQRPALMKHVLRFLQASADQAGLSAACVASHPLAARLAGWLLLCQDRVNRPTFNLTQDGMGVSTRALRSSISLTAHEFKEAGLIQYRRGVVEIVDPWGLARLACDCHRITPGLLDERDEAVARRSAVEAQPERGA